MTCMTLMPLGSNRVNPSDDSVPIVTSVCWSVVMSAVAQVSAELAVVTVVSAALTVPADPFLFIWVLMCLDKWSLRMNRLGHSGHENFFSPVNRQRASLTVLNQLVHNKNQCKTMVCFVKQKH